MNKLATLALATAFAGAAGAQGITVFVNGDPVQFNGAGARQINGRVMVPLRGVMEKLGAYVSYLPESKTVIASKGDVDMQLRIGQDFGLVNGQRRTLDVPPLIYAGTTMVPLRFMSEALGAQVSWDAPAMAVRIQTPGTTTNNDTTTNTRPQPINTGPVVIRTLDMDKSGYRRSGDRIVYTLEGTPGGQAVMQIPGLTGEIPMSEVSPGRYQAIVTIPESAMTITRGTAVARLRVGEQETALQATRNLMVDTQGPVLREPFPEGDSRIARAQPNITVTFDDLDGSGVDPEAVRVWLDNRDVTRDATVTSGAVFYRPGQALSAGQHTVRVAARDKAGNATERTWRFTVTNRATLSSETLRHTGARNLRPGQTVEFTLRTEPGSNVTYSIGDRIMNMPMREISAGVYKAEYTVRLEDDLTGVPVTARVRTPDNEVYLVESNQLLGEIGTPMRPTITSPDPSSRSVSGNTVNIQGKAGRRAKVRVLVNYTSTLLGLFKTNGTLAERTVFADENGNWSTGDIKLDQPAGTTYTVTAVTVGRNNVTSEETTYSFSK